MTNVPAFDEEKLGELLSALPPAPVAWVRSAQEIPNTRRRLERIVERADADEDFRRRAIENPEAALEEFDVVAHSEIVEILRRRLDADE